MRRPSAPPVTVEEVARTAERVAMALEAGLSADAAARAAGVQRLSVSTVVPDARDGVRALLVALDVVEQLGAPAADVLRQAAAGMRAAAAAERFRAAAVAGPVAAARIVGALPLAGPPLALLLGFDPVAVLLLTGWGRACAVAGAALLLLGAWWSRRLVGAARAASGAVPR